jgi:transposase-like protein
VAYSEEFKAAALIRLAANKNDIDRTAAEIGCSPASIRRWADGQTVQKKVQKKETFANQSDLTVADYLEQAVKQMLGSVPDNMKGNDWAIALGILLDKWLLLGGQPTERVENITRWLEELPGDVYDDVVKQAEDVVKSYSRRRDSAGVEEG